MKYFHFPDGGRIIIRNSERAFICPINDPTETEYKFWKGRYMRSVPRRDYVDYKSLRGIQQDLNELEKYIC